MKGVIFNLDMLIALIISGIALLSIANLQKSSNSDLQSNLYLSKLANDLLVVMTKTNGFNSLNSSKIYTNLIPLVPNTTAVKITIQTFKLQSGDFVKEPSIPDTIIIFPQNAVQKQSITARTIFLTFDANKIKYYNTVYLEIWQRWKE